MQLTGIMVLNPDTGQPGEADTKVMTNGELHTVTMAMMKAKVDMNANLDACLDEAVARGLLDRASVASWRSGEMMRDQMSEVDVSDRRRAN